MTRDTALLLLLAAFSAAAQEPLDRAWDLWQHARVAESRALAESILKANPASDDARRLALLAAFAAGDYLEALSQYERLGPDSPRRRELAQLVVEAYKHLNRLADAARFARATHQPEAVCNWLEQRSRKPLEVSLEKTTIVPFDSGNSLRELMPAVPVELNGKPFLAHLDTGGGYLSVSERTVAELGIPVMSIGRGEANAQSSTVSAGIVDQLKIGDARLTNVPLVALSALNATSGVKLILGTNVLQQFLVTWDNARKRLILSPRRDPERREEHFNLIPADFQTMDFYLQGDHYMFARGAVGERKDLVFFVDSGLVTIDPKGRQPGLAVTPAVLAAWGLDQQPLRFLDSPGPISLGPLQQSGLSLMVLDFGKNISWQGVKVSGLLAHGFLKHYVWTMDFDAHRWHFSLIPDAPASTAQAPATRADVYTGRYEAPSGVALEITADGARLFLQVPGQSKVPLNAEPDGTFSIPLVQANVTFSKDAAGKVTELLLDQAGNQTKAKKVR